MFQPSKEKVRPVMDYCELNAFVECRAGNQMVAVRDEKNQKVESVAWGASSGRP